MNVYIIESNDYIIINETINKIISDNRLNNDNIIKFDMTEVNITQVIEDLDTYNLLLDNKIIVCSNSYFLSPTKVKSSVEHKLSDLKKYIQNPNSMNYLIMVCDKLSDKKEIVELIKENVKIVTANISIENLIKERLETYKMDSNTIAYLIKYCLNDNEKILNELEKLKMYKFDEGIITKEDIDACVIRSYDDNVFDLVNAIAKKDRKNAHNIYERLISNDTDSTLIIGSVANNIRTLYVTKILLKEGYSIDKIANTLSVKRGAISIASENVRNFREKELLNILNVLADIDIKTKIGEVNNNLAFELFILNL